VMIIGLSSEAPRLVERLQTSKLWHSMNLTGALLPDPAKGKDRFTLAAELTIAQSAKPKPERRPAVNPANEP
jgi:general secretion pathway protein L